MSARSAVAFAALLIACSGGSSAYPPDGGNSSSGGGSSGSSSGGGNGGSSGGSSSGGGVTGVCPASPPSGGSSCPTLGLWCEYGADENIACNTLSVCDTGNVWATTAAASTGCPTNKPGAGGCPTTYSAVPVGKPCTPMGSATECAYTQGRCACTTPLSGPPTTGTPVATWVCEKPGSTCPEPRPLSGTACSPAGAMCDYGGCQLPGGTTMACTNGTWGVSSTPCAL